jgi:hypothetical protein
VHLKVTDPTTKPCSCATYSAIKVGQAVVLSPHQPHHSLRQPLVRSPTSQPMYDNRSPLAVFALQ